MQDNLKIRNLYDAPYDEDAYVLVDVGGDVPLRKLPLGAIKGTGEDIERHLHDYGNPHRVTADQVGTYTADEIDRKIEEAEGGSSEELREHIANKNNPHGVNKAQVGLGNVDNTSDADKPISGPVSSALALKADKGSTYTKNEVDAAISTATGGSSVVNDVVYTGGVLKEVKGSTTTDIVALDSTFAKNSDVVKKTDVQNSYSGTSLSAISGSGVADALGAYVPKTMIKSSADVVSMDSDNVNTYTGKAISQKISDTMSGSIGGWLGNKSVSEINSIVSSELKSGDYATITDSGIVTLGNVVVTSGDEIFFVPGEGIWQKKDNSVYIKQTDVASASKVGVVKASTAPGMVNVDSSGAMSVNGWSSLTGRVSTAESSISTLQGSTSQHSSAISAINDTINGLSMTKQGGDGKYIKSVTQTNGQVSVEVVDLNTDVSDGGNTAPSTLAVKTYVDSSVSSAISAEARKRVDSIQQTYDAASEQPISGKGVASAISTKADTSSVYTKSEIDSKTWSVQKLNHEVQFNITGVCTGTGSSTDFDNNGSGKSFVELNFTKVTINDDSSIQCEIPGSKLSNGSIPYSKLSSDAISSIQSAVTTDSVSENETRALTSKGAYASLVSKTADETIGGSKTFTNNPTIQANSYPQLLFENKNSSVPTGMVVKLQQDNKGHAKLVENAGSDNPIIAWDGTLNGYVFYGTAGSSSDPNAVHITGAQEIQGKKTFKNNDTDFIAQDSSKNSQIRIMDPSGSGQRFNLVYSSTGKRGLYDSLKNKWFLEIQGDDSYFYGTASMSSDVTTNGKTNNVIEGDRRCLTSTGAYSNLLRKGTVGGFFVGNSTIQKQLSSNRNTWTNFSQATGVDYSFVMPPKSSVVLTFSVVGMNADKSLSPANAFTVKLYCGPSSPPVDGSKDGYISTKALAAGVNKIMPLLAVNDADQPTRFFLWGRPNDSVDVSRWLDAGSLWGTGLYGTDFIHTT